VTVLEQLSQCVAQLLRDDPHHLLLGEDVRDGGMLGLSRAAAEDDALRDRLVSTPLGSHATIAYAGGLAMAGLRPIVLLPSASALLEGFAALREVARLHWRSGDRRRAPVVYVAPSGPGFGLGGDGAESPEGALAQVPGLRIVCLGSAHEACATLQSAASSDQEATFGQSGGPIVLLIPRTLAVAESTHQAPTLNHPLGSAHSLSPMRDTDRATVFAWGATLELARLAADASPFPVAVIDVGALAPLDTTGLLKAARATGKLVIAHAGPRSHGVGAELAAIFADQAILHLDAPVVRVCGHDGPQDRHGEWSALPTATAIADAIDSVVAY